MWSRLGAGSTISVVPSACNPASTSAVFTWPLGTASSVAIPCSDPPRIDSGASRPPSRPSMVAPIAAQRIDDPRHRARAQRRVAREHRVERAAGEQAREHPHRRARVPRSRAPPMARSARRRRHRGRRPRRQSHRRIATPSCSSAARVRSTSSPSAKPRIRLSPARDRREQQRAVRNALAPGQSQLPAQRARPVDHEFVGRNQPPAAHDRPLMTSARAW